MQAYASAQLTPLESEAQRAPVPSISSASRGAAAVNGAPVGQLDSASPVAALVSAIVDGLSDRDLGVLARRLLPHLRQPMELNDGHPAYTVASLAGELGVSQKTIRFAITRRELAAVKRAPGGSSPPSPVASGRRRQRRGHGDVGHAAPLFRRRQDRRSVRFAVQEPAREVGDEC